MSTVTNQADTFTDLHERIAGLRTELEALREDLAREIRTERVVVINPETGFERLRTEHLETGFELRVYADVEACRTNPDRAPQPLNTTSVVLGASEDCRDPYAGVFVEAAGDIAIAMTADDLDAASPEQLRIGIDQRHRASLYLTCDRHAVTDHGVRADLVDRVQAIELALWGDEVPGR